MKVGVVHFAGSDIRHALDFYVAKLGLPLIGQVRAVCSMY